MVNSVAFNNGGTILASGSRAELLDYEIATLKGHSYSVTSVAFNNSGTILASGSFDVNNKTMKCRILD